MLRLRSFASLLGLLLAVALCPARASADFVPCAAGMSPGGCVFGPTTTGGAPTLVPGGVDTAYVPCSNGRFVTGTVGFQSNTVARQFANQVLGLSNYRAVPLGQFTQGTGGPPLPLAVAATARTVYTLLAANVGAGTAVQLFSSSAAGPLSFGPDVRLPSIANGAQGDLDCDPQGNACVLVATTLVAPISGTGGAVAAPVFAQWFLSMSATPSVNAFLPIAPTASGGAPSSLGRPAVSYEPVGGRFWMASYASASDGTPMLTALDASPGAMPVAPFRPTPVGTAPVLPANLSQRRNALAPDGAGGVWWAWETEPGSGSTTSPVQLFHCMLSGVTIGCRQDLAWQSAASALHNVRAPSLAFDGRRLFFAMESRPTSNSLVGFVTLDAATGLWSSPGMAWPMDGAASPALASDGRGTTLLSWLMTGTGSVNTATFRTPCAMGPACLPGTTCQSVPTGSLESACVLNPGECSMPDAGDAMADASDASDSAADSRADVPGDLADAGAADTSASDAVAEASAEDTNADTQSAEDARNADSASMEASADGATSSDSAANADSANRTLTGGSCQCAAPVGTARGRGGAAALALGALGLALARRRRR